MHRMKRARKHLLPSSKSCFAAKAWLRQCAKQKVAGRARAASGGLRRATLRENPPQRSVIDAFRDAPTTLSGQRGNERRMHAMKARKKTLPPSLRVLPLIRAWWDRQAASGLPVFGTMMISQLSGMRSVSVSSLSGSLKKPLPRYKARAHAWRVSY